MVTATVSHDMRTPINSITGLVQSLENYITDEKGKRLINIVKTSSQCLLSLVNDLLDFYQMKHGKFQINMASFDIRREIKDLISMFEIQAQEKGLNLAYKINDNIPSQIIFDAQRIK